MATILPFQLTFDKDIPEDFGNFEYRQERLLLITIDELIVKCHMEDPVITYFVDMAYANKSIRMFGTGKSPYLTAVERDEARAMGVLAYRMAILRKRLKLSLRMFSNFLSHSDLYKWFCGINRFSLPKVPGKSTISRLGNLLPTSLTDEVERKMFSALQNKSLKILPDSIDFSECYFDCTCIKANVHYPVDWLLLKDATRTFMKAVTRIRKFGLLCRMPFEPSSFISKMNVLCMEMTFAKRKKGAKKIRKTVFRRMKKLLKRVAKHAAKHVALLEANWETMNLPRGQVAQIVKQIANISNQLEVTIKNAHERIVGERKVANKDKILSLYEEDIHVIVRKKDGANVEFGNTLFLAEQSDGLIIDWKLYREQAPHDTSMLKETYHRIKDRIGVELELMASDRGFDSKDNREFLEQEKVFNALCPRDPNLLKKRIKEDRFRQAQNRRSQTEARNSILVHCFCGAPMRQKEFNNRESHLALSILSHNLWVLARLKIKQIQEKIKQAA